MQPEPEQAPGNAAGMETPDNWPSCAVGPEPDLPLPEKRRPVEVKPVPTSAAPFALELDDYEAANLLHALATHPCLNSGDWYMQIRHKLDRWTLTTTPNSLYCQRPGGHHAA